MQIAIIGDSSTSTIGDYTHIYPNVLYNKISKDKNCKILNYAVPGLTSSDAKSIYFSETKKMNNDILILYLGGNDSIYGDYKGHCNHFFWRVRKFFSKKKYNEFFFIKDKFKFSYDFENFSVHNQPFDFKKNLEDIIEHASKKNIFTILINPIANKLFPSAAAIKNYEFFKLISFRDNVGNLLRGVDEWSDLLIEGINYQENKNYKESIRTYERITDKKNVLSLIAKNNLAVIYAETNPEKSRSIFKNILNIFKEYDPIIYYNLYLLEKEKNKDDAKKYLNLSYSNDFSLYRIQDKYRNTLSELKDKYNINYLDLKNILTDKDFIDYCHPKKEAHKKIAEHIVNLINTKKHTFKKSKESFYTNKLFSPDYFNDPTKNLVDYFLIEKNISKNKIMKNLSNLLSEYNFDEFSKTELVQRHRKDQNKCCIINFIKSNMTHPIFTKSLLGMEAYTPLQNEIFSMPENYIHRIMFNYASYLEKNTTDEFTGIDKSLFNSKFYKKIILRNNSFSLDLPLLTEKNYQIEIEKKVYLYVTQQNQLFTDNIHNRLKTIMFWYTRESFRYGTLSRNSMLYDKVSIDRLTEALNVLITIDFIKKTEKKYFYIQILNLLKSLNEIHENHVNRFLSEKNFDSIEYSRDLSENKKSFILALNKLIDYNPDKHQTTYQNLQVLEFYKNSPFNIYGNITTAIEQIKKEDPLITYPVLKNIFSEFHKIKIIDFGCGGGWLVNALSYHHKDKVEVTGVDFNPVAIKYAEEIKLKLNLKSKFYTSDLFTFDQKQKYDLIISLGALHHTDDCHKAIKQISTHANEKSFIFLGLYHKYGRKPFMDFFNKIKNKNEKIKFEEYKKLHRLKDKHQLYSWFKDQVLHPKETHHTVEELVPVFEGIRFKMVSTSINNFGKINNFNNIIESEKKLFDYGIKKLENKEYFPGFFITVAKKI